MKTPSPCPCLTETLHRRTVAPRLEVVWTDTEGCPCTPGVNLMRYSVNSAAEARALAAHLTKAADLMDRIEATTPGSPERAAIHTETECETHSCDQEGATRTAANI